MTKIERTKQEIFANQAGSRQITAFGTAKTENPVFTTDLTEIQNSNFLQGWLSALLPDKSPWEEDMNAVLYAITKQLAYLFQEGMPEYDPNTEYSLNALTRGVGSNVIYCSVVAENLGHDLNDPNYWVPFITGGTLAGYEIGKPEITLSNTLLANEIWLEGGKVAKNLYPKLAEIYGNTYAPSTATDTDTYLYLPDFRNRTIWGALNFGYIEAGLPNHTHTYKKITSTRGNYTGLGAPGPTSYDENGQTGDVVGSAIYGNSNTVQPPAIKVRVKTRYK